MFAEKHYPEELLPEELDAYLAQGWYRMGQSIFTTHFLCFGEQFYSAIWVRLALQGYEFSKRLRKLVRRNDDTFETVFTPFDLTKEKEELYLLYKQAFPGTLAPSLKDSLMDGEESSVYNTWEVNVYDRDELVAVSFFDVGKGSAASIMGIYHPDYSRHSLGFYTLLMEILFCKDRKMEYFYPGYVVPGYPRFDYKLRIGAVDYLNLSNRKWMPFTKLTSAEVPLDKMVRKLDELQEILKKTGLTTRRLFYPLFEANLFAFWQTDYFDFPIFLLCYPQEKASEYFIVIYDVMDEAYHLLECAPMDDLMFYVNDSYVNLFDKRRFFLELLVIKDKLSTSKHIEQLLPVIQTIIPYRRLK